MDKVLKHLKLMYKTLKVPGDTSPIFFGNCDWGGGEIMAREVAFPTEVGKPFEIPQTGWAAKLQLRLLDNDQMMQ